MKTKKASYSLIVEYENGDSSCRGGLTQTRCYEILERYRTHGWSGPMGSFGPDGSQAPSGPYIRRWKIETSWQTTDL